MIVTRGELYDFFFFSTVQVLGTLALLFERTRPRLCVITNEFPGQTSVIWLIPVELLSSEEPEKLTWELIS